jgi:signal transduction histidine kinase
VDQPRSAAGSAFDLSLKTAADPAAAPGLVETPLFAETPALGLVVRQRALDPAGDRRRHRLFAAAVVAGLALTLLAGGLALRDVSRELRTAVLRSTFVASVTHELRTPLASIRLPRRDPALGRARPEATTEP